MIMVLYCFIAAVVYLLLAIACRGLTMLAIAVVDFTISEYNVDLDERYFMIEEMLYTWIRHRRKTYQRVLLRIAHLILAPLIAAITIPICVIAWVVIDVYAMGRGIVRWAIR